MDETVLKYLSMMIVFGQKIAVTIACMKNITIGLNLLHHVS